MNILFISPNSPELSIGGVERSITNLIQYCKKQQAHVITILLPGLEKRVEKISDHVTLQYEVDLFVPKGVRPQKEIREKVIGFTQTLEAIMVSQKIDIICAENFHVGLPAAYSLHLHMLTSKHHIPVILRLHSFAKKDLQIEMINQLTWDRISCVSKSVTGDCFQKGADIDILSTDYLGVDTDEFNDAPPTFSLKSKLNLDESTKIILTAGRIIVGQRSIIVEKGFVNLIRAFSKLAPHNPELRLLFAVGKPTDILKNEYDAALRMLEGHIRLNHIEDQTIVKQFALHEMADVYKGSDVFVLASENETFGQVFVESMACGLPVIGTKVGGIPEIISDSYNGFLVNPDDASGLAQRMNTLMTDQALRDQFIKAGKKVISEKFTASDQFLSYFNKLQHVVMENRKDLS